MHELSDILGDVRGDREYYSLKQFVQPGDPLVQRLALILSQSENPVATAQDFVYRLVKYRTQNGELWRFPAEILSQRNPVGDCDDKSILLCSILRNYFPAEDVHIAVGSHNSSGHAWVVLDGEIIESTADSKKKVNVTKYHPEVLFNDRYAYSMNSDSFGFLMVKGKYRLQIA